MKLADFGFFSLEQRCSETSAPAERKMKSEFGIARFTPLIFWNDLISHWLVRQTVWNSCSLALLFFRKFTELKWSPHQKHRLSTNSTGLNTPITLKQDDKQSWHSSSRGQVSQRNKLIFLGDQVGNLMQRGVSQTALEIGSCVVLKKTIFETSVCVCRIAAFLKSLGKFTLSKNAFALCHIFATVKAGMGFHMMLKWSSHWKESESDHSNKWFYFRSAHSRHLQVFCPKLCAMMIPVCRFLGWGAIMNSFASSQAVLSVAADGWCATLKCFCLTKNSFVHHKIYEARKWTGKWHKTSMNFLSEGSVLVLQPLVPRFFGSCLCRTNTTYFLNCVLVFILSYLYSAFNVLQWIQYLVEVLVLYLYII